MKFIEPSGLRRDPDVAARKLMVIANAVERLLRRTDCVLYFLNFTMKRPPFVHSSI